MSNGEIDPKFKAACDNFSQITGGVYDVSAGMVVDSYQKNLKRYEKRGVPITPKKQEVAFRAAQMQVGKMQRNSRRRYK
jgi:hypothetical protein